MLGNHVFFCHFIHRFVAAVCLKPCSFFSLFGVVIYIFIFHVFVIDQQQQQNTSLVVVVRVLKFVDPALHSSFFFVLLRTLVTLAVLYVSFWHMIHSKRFY